MSKGQIAIVVGVALLVALLLCLFMLSQAHYWMFR